MGSICERISAISRIVFEIFDHICGPFIYAYHNSSKYSRMKPTNSNKYSTMKPTNSNKYLKIEI